MKIKKLQKALEALVGERINIKYRSSTTKITSIEGTKILAISNKSIFLEIDIPNQIKTIHPKPYIEVAIENVTRVTFY